MPSRQRRGILGKATRSIVLMNTHLSLTNITGGQSCTSEHIAYDPSRSHVISGTQYGVSVFHLQQSKNNSLRGPMVTYKLKPSCQCPSGWAELHATCLGKNLECTFPSWWFMARHPVCIHCSITQSPPLVSPSRLRECDDHNCSALWKRLRWVSVWQHVSWAAVKRSGHGCWSRRSAWLFEFCTSTSVAQGRANTAWDMDPSVISPT